MTSPANRDKEHLLRGARVLQEQSTNALDRESGLDEVPPRNPATDGKAAPDAPNITIGRHPGVLAGRIRVAPDFDRLPGDIAAAFGLKHAGRTKPRPD